MELSAFLLVLSAAVVHALWNLVAKRTAGNLGVFWLGLVLAGLIILPVAVLFAPPPDLDGLPFIVATGLIHAFYFGLLAGAYRLGEMSVVYPLARGSGVVGTCVVASLLLGETVSLRGALGIAAITVGVLLIGLRELIGRAQLHAYALALLVGLTTTAYSIVDKLGVARVQPLWYSTGLNLGTALFLAPYVLVYQRAACWTAWRNQRNEAVFIGLGSMATYLAILFAFRLANASYVVAVREVSIVVVALLSVVVLKEAMTVLRGLAILAILVGVVLVKVA